MGVFVFGQDNRGYSIVELSIVLAVTAILLVVGTNMFRSYVANRNLKEAAGAMMSDIKMAKQKAMSEDRDYVLTILSATSYNVQGGLPRFLSDFGEGIQIKQNNFSGNIIRCQPRGTCTMGSVVLQNSIGSEINITVNQTGRVRSDERLK
jgi:prepilin-type N-terminal cleavage/methylation domain-containing protein